MCCNSGQPGATHVSHTPAACSFPGENARSWEALGEARRRHSRVTTGISAFPLGWPWEAQSSPQVARESRGLRSGLPPGTEVPLC